MNDRNFEDRGRSLGEIISLFFETLYLWTAAYVSPLKIYCSQCSIFCILFILVVP